MPHLEAQSDSMSPGWGPPAAPTLLELFSPAVRPAVRHSNADAAARRAMWEADAQHRANNLAQMWAALSSSRLSKLLGGKARRQAAKARALSRAYTELAVSTSGGASLPCRPLLESIATLLIELFGAERSISLRFHGDDVALAAEHRRALLLIASELIINALKYAYPQGQSGVISVSLELTDDTIRLIVSDEGVGLSDQVRPGGGTRLTTQMGALLGATIEPSAGVEGLSTTVTVPRLRR